MLNSFSGFHVLDINYVLPSVLLNYYRAYRVDNHIKNDVEYKKAKSRMKSAVASKEVFGEGNNRETRKWLKTTTTATKKADKLLDG